MADQVTVSTFLELKDNMSTGLERLNGLLKQVQKFAGTATASLTKVGKAAQTAAAGVKAQQSAIAQLDKKLISQKQTVSRIEATNSASARRAIIATESLRRTEDKKSLDSALRVAEKRNTAFATHKAEDGSTLSLELSAANDQVDTLIAAGASLAGVYSFGSAISSALELNKQYENLQDRISGTLVATKMASNIDLAQKKSARVLEAIQAQAAELPGEAQEYAENFALALPKTIASGMTNLTQAADFISKYTAVAISNGVDAAQAGRDLMLMLTGTVDSQARSYSVLSEKIGLTAEQFNKLSAMARREAIQKALVSYEALLNKVGVGFDAQVGAVTSAVKDVILQASQPMFEQSKRVLADINSWLEKNKKLLVDTGRVIGSDVVVGFNAVLKVAKFLGEHIDDIYQISRLFFEVWASTKIIVGVMAIVKAMRALRASIVAVRTASVGARLTTAAPAAGAAVGAVAGGLAARGAATAAGAASAVNPWVFGATVAATVGAELYTRSEENKAQEEEAAKERAALAEKTSRFESALRRSDAGAIKSAFVGAGGVTHGFRKVLSSVAQTHKDMLPSDITSEAFYEALVKNRTKLNSQFGLTEDVLRAYGQYRDFDFDAADMGVPAAIEETKKELKKAPKDRTHTVNDFRFSRFDIKQEFAEGFDPDRIAVAFASDLARVGEFKVQSMNSPAITPAH